MSFVIILVAMVALMYFLMIRPQQAQKRRTQDMLKQLGPGDEVITVGGIYGDVIEVSDDKVVLEIAEDVHIEVTRRAIASVVPPEAEAEEADDRYSSAFDDKADPVQGTGEVAGQAAGEVEEPTR